MKQMMYPEWLPDGDKGYFYGVDKTPLWYFQTGSGPAVVCCNGIACTISYFKYLLQALKNDYRVILWDYRGHGRSQAPRSPNRVAISDLAGDLHCLMNHLKIEQAVLVGHSMGVQVVLEYAHQHPARTSALIPISGSFGRPGDYFLHIGALRYCKPFALCSFIFPSLFRDGWRRTIHGSLTRPVTNLIGVNSHLVSDDDMNEYFDHLAEMEPRIFFRMVKAMQGHSAEEYLEKIRVPTLIICGRNDHFTPFWISLRMHDRIRSSEMMAIPEGSHVVLIETPNLVNDRIQAFIARICDRANDHSNQTPNSWSVGEKF